MEFVVRRHFQVLFTDHGYLPIVDQMWVNYSILFSEDEGSRAVNLVSLDEIKIVLKGYAKSKILGSDGWNMELFLEFVDTMGLNLLVIVEESQR